MKTEEIIQMIDEYLEEPHSLSASWVEVLETCKQAILDRKYYKVYRCARGSAKSSRELREYTDTVRAEAIKEFAERLKRNIDEGELYGKHYDYVLTIEHIDYLVKEMVGENSDR